MSTRSSMGLSFKLALQVAHTVYQFHVLPVTLTCSKECSNEGAMEHICIYILQPPRHQQAAQADAARALIRTACSVKSQQKVARLQIVHRVKLVQSSGIQEGPAPSSLHTKEQTAWWHHTDLHKPNPALSVGCTPTAGPPTAGLHSALFQSCPCAWSQSTLMPAGMCSSESASTHAAHSHENQPQVTQKRLPVTHSGSSALTLHTPQS